MASTLPSGQSEKGIKDGVNFASWSSFWLLVLGMGEPHVAKRYVQGVPAELTEGKFPRALGASPKDRTWRNV